MTTRGGKQVGKSRAMSFRKVSYFILDISKSCFMQLNVSRRLHDDFAPARRPRKIIRNAKRQAFCRQHSNAGTLQRAGLALFK